MMAGVEEVEVVVAHHERATLRVGDVFLKIDADQRRTDVEVEAMALAPIPTPQVLWRKPPVLALAALPGTALGRLGEPSVALSAAWAAAGAAARMLHEAPLPPWPGRSLEETASHLDGECEWLVTNGVLPTEVVTRNRRVAEAALRPWTPVFTHGDLQVAHVFVEVDQITGVVDWSEAGQGDALYDLASLTLGHQEHLGDDALDIGVERRGRQHDEKRQDHEREPRQRLGAGKERVQMRMALAQEAQDEPDDDAVDREREQGGERQHGGADEPVRRPGEIVAQLGQGGANVFEHAITSASSIGAVAVCVERHAIGARLPWLRGYADQKRRM